MNPRIPIVGLYATSTSFASLLVQSTIFLSYSFKQFNQLHLTITSFLVLVVHLRIPVHFGSCIRQKFERILTGNVNCQTVGTAPWVRVAVINQGSVYNGGVDDRSEMRSN